MANMRGNGAGATKGFWEPGRAAAFCTLVAVLLLAACVLMAECLLLVHASLTGTLFDPAGVAVEGAGTVVALFAIMRGLSALGTGVFVFQKAQARARRG